MRGYEFETVDGGKQVIFMTQPFRLNDTSDPQRCALYATDILEVVEAKTRLQSINDLTSACILLTMLQNDDRVDGTLGIRLQNPSKTRGPILPNSNRTYFADTTIAETVDAEIAHIFDGFSEYQADFCMDLGRRLMEI